MVWTGVDGDLSFSIEVGRLKKEWKPTTATGRKIFVVPSHLSLVKFGETDLKDPRDVRKAVSLEVEEKFGNVLWDVKVLNGRYILAVVKDFQPPEDAYALDLEVFSLVRCAKANGLEECTVVNLKKGRTTLVRVRGGSLESYRVMLRGREHVKDPRDLKRILEEAGWSLKEEVLLCGEVEGIKGLEEVFGKVRKNAYGGPRFSAAFGASLRYILPDEAPDFREEEVTGRELRKFLVLKGASFLLFLGSVVGSSLLTDSVAEDIRKSRRDIFTRSFPDLPPFGIMDQLRSMTLEKKLTFTEALLRTTPLFGRDVRIYRIEFSGSETRIVGEVKNEEGLRRLNPESFRKTPEGTYEFEVVVR